MKKSKGKKKRVSPERDINGHGYQLKVEYTPAHITLKVTHPFKKEKRKKRFVVCVELM